MSVCFDAFYFDIRNARFADRNVSGRSVIKVAGVSFLIGNFFCFSFLLDFKSAFIAGKSRYRVGIFVARRFDFGHFIPHVVT